MSADPRLVALQADVDLFAGATRATRLDALPGWGSLAVLLVVLHCETRHGFAITSAQVRACATVGELLELIPEKT
jgi:hypothetical protein